MIATATNGRNCVAVEEDLVLYINSKVHVVDAGVGVAQKQQQLEQLETGKEEVAQNQQQQLETGLEEQTEAGIGVTQTQQQQQQEQLETGMINIAL